MDTYVPPEQLSDDPQVAYESPITVKNIFIYVSALVLALSLPVTMWVSSRNTHKPSRANTLPLGSIRINPEIITTDIKGQPIYLSALAYDTGGNPIWSGVSYQWGMSSTNAVGTLIPNANDKLATFVPSATNRGIGDIWVRGTDTTGQTVIKSIPTSTGVTPTPTPTILPTPTPYIKLLQPNGGEQLNYGQPYVIKWNSISYFDYINISLTNQQGQGTSIVQQLSPALTQYTWSVTNDQLSGGLYKIEIHGRRGALNPVIDTSDTFFSIIGIPTPTPTPTLVPTATPTPTTVVTPTKIPTPTNTPIPTKPNSPPIFTARVLAIAKLRKPYLGYITAVDIDKDAMTMTIRGLPNGLRQGICTQGISATRPFGSSITCTITGSLTKMGIHIVTATVKDTRGGVTKQSFPLIALPW